MKITINDSDEYNDYFTLTGDGGKEYPWHSRKGVKQDPEKVMLLILKRQYPGADPKPKEGETDLQAMERWIKECHTNPEISHEVEEQVSPAVFALTPDDPVMQDRRVKERRVRESDAENERRQKDRRQTKPEILEPAKFETRKVIDRPRQVIEQVPWKSTHPKKLEAMEALKNATTIAGLKAALLEIL